MGIMAKIWSGAFILKENLCIDPAYMNGTGNIQYITGNIHKDLAGKGIKLPCVMELVWIQNLDPLLSTLLTPDKYRHDCAGYSARE